MMQRIHYLGAVLLIASGLAVLQAQNNVSSPLPVNPVSTASLGAGTAPSYMEVVGGQYNSSAPAPSAGQTLGLQLAPNGSLVVQGFRRSQMGVATGNIASTTAATMISAAGSGVYTDIVSLVLTLSAETTAAYITVNVSDGTNTYKFGIASEAVGTAGAGAGNLVINFPVPLPATSANTAWTIALSAADATVQYTVIYVKQTANF
jgi:hypothetical protein